MSTCTDMDSAKFCVVKDKRDLLEDIYMIEVNKEIGKYLKQMSPHLCVKTSHNRHYYATECAQVTRLIEKMETEKVVSTYPG